MGLRPLVGGLADAYASRLGIDEAVSLGRAVDAVGEVQPRVEPLGAVGRAALVREHAAQLVVERRGVFLGVEIAITLTPVGPAAREAVEDLARVALPAEHGLAVRVEQGGPLGVLLGHAGAPEVLLGKDIGRHGRPGGRYAHVVEVEDDGAVRVADLGDPRRPFDALVGIATGCGESTTKLHAYLSRGAPSRARRPSWAYPHERAAHPASAAAGEHRLRRRCPRGHATEGIASVDTGGPRTRRPGYLRLSNSLSPALSRTSTTAWEAAAPPRRTALSLAPPPPRTPPQRRLPQRRPRPSARSPAGTCPTRHHGQALGRQAPGTQTGATQTGATQTGGRQATCPAGQGAHVTCPVDRATTHYRLWSLTDEAHDVVAWPRTERTKEVSVLNLPVRSGRSRRAPVARPTHPQDAPAAGREHYAWGGTAPGCDAAETRRTPTFLPGPS